ncbi:TPA: restriction endonuclease subunit S [Staphylococcus aureus]|nr:restriction endonuclease subunit S [Staphylococcus aureus]HDG6067086.1 restriction endonuclease subunit S [Staphylococcus aureus]
MSNTQKKNVPELRFPGFEGEWEEKKLEDIGTLKNGINKDKESFGYGFPFVNLNDVFNSKEIQIKNLSLINSTYKEREEYNLQKGDTLFIRSSVKPSGVGLTKVIEIDLKNVVFSGFLIRFRNNNLAVNFKKFIFNSISVRKQILSLSSTSANTNINQESLKKVKIPIPCMDEQQKIGRFFSKLDRQIELEEQKLELIQQQKKCYMQKIFSQELRFKDENGNDYPEWENVMLQKVLKDKTEGIKRGPFGGALKKDIFVESGYAVYEQRNAIYDISNFRYYINENKYKEMQSFSVQPNDIIMSCSGTIGRLSLIPQNFTKGIINQALIRFRTNHKIRSEFFLIFMRSNQMQRKILEANPGSAITNLVPVKELKLIPFPLPVKFEQDKISQFILIINRRIEQSEKKIESLKNRKQGFLQKLFV